MNKDGKKYKKMNKNELHDSILAKHNEVRRIVSKVKLPSVF